MSAQGWIVVGMGIVGVILLVVMAVDGYQKRKSFLRQQEINAWRRD